LTCVCGIRCLGRATNPPIPRMFFALGLYLLSLQAL
jgi:hypothetical protein